MRAQGRRHCFNDLKRRLRETLKYTYRVWDEGAFQGRVLSNYNLFLNLHKDCGDAHNPVHWPRQAAPATHLTAR